MSHRKNRVSLDALEFTLNPNFQQCVKLFILFFSCSCVLWGEAAIEAYQAGKNGPATLWHEHSITQVLDLLDSKLLVQSAKHFPQQKPLQVRTALISAI